MSLHLTEDPMLHLTEAEAVTDEILSLPEDLKRPVILAFVASVIELKNEALKLISKDGPASPTTPTSGST